MGTRLAAAFQHFDRAELRVCRFLNRPSDSLLFRGFFGGVSRLGDGWIWYALIVAQPLVHGTQGWFAAAHLAATAGVGLLLYKLIKRRSNRERPYITHTAIQCAVAPLDRYSFPSGHTLHAVSFAILATRYFPELAFPLAGFALLSALSRVVLGLHYPTDVAAGALLGGGIAILSLQLEQLLTTA